MSDVAKHETPGANDAATLRIILYRKTQTRASILTTVEDAVWRAGATVVSTSLFVAADGAGTICVTVRDMPDCKRLQTLFEILNALPGVQEAGKVTENST